MAATDAGEALALERWHLDARERTLALIAGLDEEQLMGPRLRIVNPLRWELGHVAWFQEYWVLRHARGHAPLHDRDGLYDSAKVAHDTRWDLSLPSTTETYAYLAETLERSLAGLRGGGLTDAEAYFHRLAIFHEDMHDEAFTYTRQTLAYPDPRLESSPAPSAGSLPGDVRIPGGRYRIGAEPDGSFVFDNEKWAHEVEVATFSMARAPVTNEEFAAFVSADGYARPEIWSPGGWRWRNETAARHPVYWRPTARGGFEQRRYDRWEPLAPHHPVIHVSWFEAEAWCRFAGRRLPTEAEWEVAAAAEAEDRASSSRRRFPWGDDPPTRERVNLDGRFGGCVDVAALPAGDSAFGCRQMMGNVWEWTASDFGPYPGFVVDPYREYSQPWFGDHKVLRGGCWATRGRLLRNTWRNFYTPDRCDVFAGFRTCSP